MWLIRLRLLVAIVLLLFAFGSSLTAYAQAKPEDQKASVADTGARVRLVLGPEDEADLAVYVVPELTQHLHLNSSGEASLALIGKVKLSGFTADEAQAFLEKKYADGGFLKNPHITLTVKDYSTQGITVLGEVTHPGTYSALGARRLFDVFLLAGGLTPRAGTKVSVTHAGADHQTTIIMLTADPVNSAENNVQLTPGDTVIVSRAGVVYVVGEVGRPGGFVIDDPDGKMTVSRAMAMAFGPTRLANLAHAQMIRRAGSGIESKQLDIKKIMKAQTTDIALQADDIIFIPASKGKMMVEGGANSAVSMIANLAIYRF